MPETMSGMTAMKLDHHIAQCVVAGGVRRSARMAMMRWDDPEISDFLVCKTPNEFGMADHWTTNISVIVNDEFHDAIKAEDEVALEVLSSLSKGMLENGEPGFWDESLSQENEPNRVICTNPCGEQPLEAWESCNLGHVNLANHSYNDITDMAKSHLLLMRFLIRATYGDVNDEKQAEVMNRNRRTGLGHLGFAEFVAKHGVSYAESSNVEWVQDLLQQMATVVDMEAEAYAHDLRIPVPVKKRTVAPTGSVAKLPGTSEGIHPIFAQFYIRRVRFSSVDPGQLETVDEYRDQGYKVENDAVAANTVIVEFPTKDAVLARVADVVGEERAKDLVESADQLSLQDMLKVQALYQMYWSDNAVSYTANVDPDKYSVEELNETLMEFFGKLKGATIFPEQSFTQPPYERISPEEYEAATNKFVEESYDIDCATGACPIK